MYTDIIALMKTNLMVVQWYIHGAVVFTRWITGCASLFPVYNGQCKEQVTGPDILSDLQSLY